MKAMYNVFLCVLLGLSAACANADGIEGKKVYECRYMEKAPYGVTAWSESDMVKNGIGKETRFVPYNSDSAKGLVNDVNALRTVYEETNKEGTETSFYMAYDKKGWSIYIHCQRPDIEERIDTQKDVSLEIFFAPGLSEVPYYQMIVRQLAGTVNFYDWGMPHRDYRSIKDTCKVESLALDDGVATSIFVPWDSFYDRLPFNDDHWIFSFMRWDTRVTWGGNVHDTGNFGLVKFVKPDAETATAIQKKLLRRGLIQFNRTAAREKSLWSDEKLGDADYYNNTLEPLIKGYEDKIAALGAEADWDAAAIENASLLLKDCMEFKYVASAARKDYLQGKQIGREIGALGTLVADQLGFTCYQVPALSSVRRLPYHLGYDAKAVSAINFVAAKGEFEPASFVIQAHQNVPALELRATDLTNGANQIPASNVDIKIVKCWYQGGTAWYSYFADPNRKELVPELLLNDEKLLRVDREKKDNYLRIGDEYRWISYPASKDEEFGKFNYVTEPVADAKTLQPIELIKDEYKQIWVTVKIPQDADDGIYTGNIELIVGGQVVSVVRVTAKVLPYELPMPKTYYDLDKSYLVSIYGAGFLRQRGIEALTPEAADKQQMAIYKNILDHNVFNARATFMLAHARDRDAAKAKLQHEIRLMKQAGFVMKPFLTRGWTYPAGNESQEDIQSRIDDFAATVEAEVGHHDIYMTTWDEATAARVKIFRGLGEYAHSKGIKIWATTSSSHLNLAGYVIDFSNLGGGKPNREDAARWHALGSIVTSYASPHMGIENPDIFRRWEGLARYKANFDASYNFQYMSSEGNPNIWNEANARAFRSFCMVYPTIDGVIDTIEWEGFREGIDDVRYATKLKQDAAKAIASGNWDATLVAKKALLWLELVDETTEDLNTVRLEIIEQIAKIDAAMNK